MTETAGGPPLDPAARAVLEEATTKPWRVESHVHGVNLVREGSTQAAVTIYPKADCRAIVHAVNMWAAREARIAELERGNALLKGVLRAAETVGVPHVCEYSARLAATLEAELAKAQDGLRYCGKVVGARDRSPGEIADAVERVVRSAEEQTARLAAQLAQARAALQAVVDASKNKWDGLHDAALLAARALGEST